jgi:tartrate dehydrogenase/decarboxylase/D-malate dehydrogenase
MRTVDVAVIPGDGIGAEVMEAGRAMLEAAALVHGGLRFRFEEFPWSCRWYLEHGQMMPDDGLARLEGHEAILLGAVGYPGVPDHVSLWGLLIPIRRGFDQYVNLRPARLLKGVPSPLKDFPPRRLDLVVVRENSEGEYSDVGGRFRSGTPEEVVMSTSVFTRKGVERIVEYAATLAEERGCRFLAGATKSNGLRHTMPFWDEIFHEVARRHPALSFSLYHVDALAAALVQRPDQFEVVVASNLFGDILTDLTGAVAGGIGLMPSANLNPEGRFPSMFEPVHGSAPDIAGQGVANPVGMLWTVSLMLEHLGYGELAGAVLEAVEHTLEAGVRTPDLGGRASTREVTEAVLARLHTWAG